MIEATIGSEKLILETAEKQLAGQREVAELEPMHDRVIFSPIAKQNMEKTASGLVTVRSNIESDELDRGEVIFIGAGRPYDKGILPMTIKVGDVIVYNNRVPFWSQFNGKRVGTVRESDVFHIERYA